MNESKNDCMLSFRCSQTGSKFEVTFSRRSPGHQFRIQLISGPVPEASYKIFSQRASQSHKSGESNTGSTASKSNDFDAGAFDFSGWYCGCCRFGHPSDSRTVYHSFVRCGTCHGYVCGATVRQIGEGVLVFECVGDCKGGGVLGGTITSYQESDSVRADARQLRATNDVLRLTPAK